MTQEKLTEILTVLQAELSHLLGDWLEAIYLFGSHARGDSRLDSDIDILIIMRDDFDYKEMLDRTIDLVADLSLKYEVVIPRAFVTKSRFEYEMSPFLMNVRREVVAI